MQDRGSLTRGIRCWQPALIALVVLTVAFPGRSEAQGLQVPSPAARMPLQQGTGLPIPRFVSLKSDRVHLRQGPGFDYKVLWVFRRAGLPVEVLKEFEGWRQVRDSDGTIGWLLQALISGRRTAAVMPWAAKTNPLPNVELKADDASSSTTVAKLEAGVIAFVRSCDGQWCSVAVGELTGYLEQKKLWGVYDGERIK